MQHQYGQPSIIIAIAIFAIVYFLIMFGRRRLGIPIWTSMLIGAALMIAFQIIDTQSAFKSINLDVICFLFGMLSIVSALDNSGVLRLVSIKMLEKAKHNPSLILMAFVVGLGLLSAFLVNDTIAVIGIPLVIYISRHVGIRSQVLLIALAFGITVGSTMTPIGNPQNLLIAIQSGIPLPFLTFIRYLGIPTIVNLFLTYFILMAYYRKELFLLPSNTMIPTMTNGHQQSYHDAKKRLEYSKDCLTGKTATLSNGQGAIITNPRLAKISIIILLTTIAGFMISDLLQFAYHTKANLSLSTIALLGATALYALAKERMEILVTVDYSVLVFFAAMFVFTYGLWSSGIVHLVLSYFPTPDKNDTVQSNAIISAISITLSQLLSNVPFVAIYNMVMINNGFANGVHGSGSGSNDNTSQWMMLAAACTIAGNLTVLAAASNIIIVESAESRGIKAFTFFEYFKIGVIVTLANIVVYYFFILLL
ncbi:MAG TPA: SLC13 family permease [Nitrososphaeraceae archaeon]|nr:SLC13 family permease [Nitrososphaeraceae archaeon]